MLWEKHKEFEMTVAEQVVEFLGVERARAHCDDCIADLLSLSRRQQAYHVTNVLGLTRDYTRTIGTCNHCKDQTKLVTSYSL